MAMMDEILRFWLQEVGPSGWYQRDDDVDAAIRARFGACWQQAADLAPRWAATPQGALAALILTDQFPRNMFREDARSFASDALARQLAREAIPAGHDLAIVAPERQFFYMPFEHSEELADQDRAVALFAERLPDWDLRHAQAHRDVIAHFGRFPWRNDVLGRASRAAETAFLAAGGYGALVAGRVSLAEFAEMI